MKFSFRLLLMCLFICPVLLESCRESSSYPSVVTSGFEGEYVVTYGPSSLDYRCSTWSPIPPPGQCSFTVSREGENGARISGEGCEWWAGPVFGRFNTDGSFDASWNIMCIRCCCVFEISGRFYSDKTMKGEVYLNFSFDKDCGLYIPIQGMRMDVAPYELPENDNECIGDLDCQTSGCSGEVCSPESVATICIYRPPPPGCWCGCVSGRCKWH